MLLGYLVPTLTQRIVRGFMDIQYLTKISDVLRKGVSTGLDVFDFANSFSQTQLESKKWLIDELCKAPFKKDPSILILGGWYGSYLVPLLRQHIQPSHIYFNDIEQKCLDIAAQLHQRFREDRSISFHCFDATSTFKQFSVDIVINTSCEHMKTYDEMFKQGKEVLYVLQTCDEENDPGHVNVSKSTQEFREKTNLSHVFTQSRKSLGHKNRFLIIGKQ